jgi:hypothetical protein
MRSSFALLALGALVIAGCQRAATPGASAPAVVNHVDQAKTALATANWAAAAPHLRAALLQDPDSLFLHSSLAVCATWLDLKDEAIREFEWVVTHAPADSEETKTARSWLAANRAAIPSAAAGLTTDDSNAGDGRVHGQVLWGESAQAPAPLSRYQVFLMGLRDTPTKEFFRALRTDASGNYAFAKVPAGSYKLTDTIGPDPRWRMKVTVEQGQDLSIDLTPDNSVKRRDDFPERQ